MNQIKKSILAFCIGIASLSILGIYLVISINSYRKAFDRVTNTQTVISETRSMLIDILNSESTVRGYVITGNVRLLKYFQEDSEKLENTFLKLKNLKKDNPSQQVLLDSLYHAVNLKYDFSKEISSVMQKKETGLAIQIIKTGKGIDLMEDVIIIFDKFIRNEKKLLSERVYTANQIISTIIKIVIVKIILAIVIACISVFLFIKNYKRREHLEEKLLEYQYFFYNTANFVCIANMQGYFEVVNTNFEKVLGYSKTELLESQFLNFVHPDDIDLTLKEIKKLKSGAKTINFENRYRKNDGNYLWFVWNATPNPVSGKLYAVARDITAIKIGEEKIRIVHERYDILARATSDTIWDCDILNNRTNYNEGISKMFGYENQEVNHDPNWWKNNIHPVDHPVVSARINEACDKKYNTIEMEYQYRCADGTYKHINDRVFFIYNETDTLIRMIGAMQDVTEKKNLALEVSKAKESFLANMSHEIRTPLNAIIGFLRALEKQELSGLQKTYIDNSSIASKHLMAMLNNILDLSKIEAGEIVLELKDFFIEDSLNNVHKVLDLKAKQKEIKLTTFISDKVNKVFEGDSLRLEEILFNLIGNALQFTQKGNIHVSCELLSDSNNSQIIHISVADTGIGMEPKYAKLIFDKFSQEDKSITRKYGGTGLGMTITKELVNLMGGEIEIESEKNIGTTIHVKLNLKKGNIENVIKLPTEINFNLDGLSILLVEDNEINRMVIQSSLQYFNCNVTEAENGLDALEILKAQHFDLILMDIQMPKMDGIEATKVIRKELKLSTPIIALTANAFKTKLKECKEAGMNDYVIKPFQEKVLLQTIVKHTINKNGIPSLDNEMNPNQPLYNLNVLRNSSRGSEEFVLKMVGVFVEQTIATIEKIDAALVSNDFLEISKLIHEIRPSTANMGVLSIQSQMKILEKIAKESQNKVEITGIYTLVKNTLQLVISQLQKNELH